MVDFGSLEQYLTPRNLLIGGAAVVAGFFIAPRLFGNKQTQPAEVLATPVEQPYAVANTEGYSPVQGSIAPPVSVVPMPSQGPPTGHAPKPPIGAPHPTPRPNPPPKPTGPPIFLPGSPRPNPTPQLPGPPRANPSIPGGYSGTCREVQPRNHAHPNDLSHDGIKAWIKAAGGSGVQAQKRALAMAIWGNTGKPTLSDVANKYLLLGGAYTNSERVKNGLRPLTQQSFDQLKADVANEIHNQHGRTSVSDNFIYHLFDTYHTPYLC